MTFAPRAHRSAARRLCHERPGPAMVGYGPRTYSARAGFPANHRALRCGDASVGPIFLVGRTWPRRKKPLRMHRTEIAQPAIFAMQVALAKLWKSWGVQPAAIVGHSVGEVAAACVAGVLSLEEAARVIVLRARFMDGCARGEGTMLAIGLDEDDSASTDCPA